MSAIQHLKNPMHVVLVRLQAKVVQLKIPAKFQDAKYFKIEKVLETKYIEASCQICLPNKKIIKGSKSVTTNFVKHLKRIHARVYEEYQRKASSKKAGINLVLEY